MSDWGSDVCSSDLLNTLLISAPGIIFSTLLGLAVCMERLSSNWLLSRLSGLYIEPARTIPMLPQMFFWYVALLFGLPGTGSGAVGQFSLDTRGLPLPALLLDLARSSCRDRGCTLVK